MLPRRKCKMPNTNNIHLWRCDLTLHDYLFFATIKRGNVSETGRFIHNYSLTYALGWARSEWHTERQEPQYAKQLGKSKGIYVTPANLLTGDCILMPYRTEIESYALWAIPDSDMRGWKPPHSPGGLRDGRPLAMDHGVVKCFRPGSVFRFYVLARFHLDRIPPLVRLGRFMAKAEIMKQCPMELEVAKGDYTASLLLNWDDLAAKPSLCDVIICALPGRLIDNARFVGTRYLRAEFTDGKEVKLPLEMGYFQKELCYSWLENAA
jgi:CRISPR-associated protein Csc1